MHRHTKSLLKLIRLHCLKTGDFTLSSGIKSDYFIDLKLISVNSHGANLIGKVLYRQTKDLPLAAIGGMQAGAIPLVTAAVVQYRRRGKFREGFWIRPERKDHGTRQRVEGVLTEGDNVVVVEDVSTTGQSAMGAVEVVRECGGNVLRVVSLVDRLQGAKDLFAKEGIDFCSVFTIDRVLEKAGSKLPVNYGGKSRPISLG